MEVNTKKVHLEWEVFRTNFTSSKAFGFTHSY